MKHNPLIPMLILIGILITLLIVTTIGWTRAHSTHTETSSFRQSLSVCEDMSSFDTQNTCFERLSELSKLLDEYGNKLRASQSKVK